ncbi:MAG TPA: O-antigen ligase family protein [Gammaproteobacteria bacterium]|nr:O-antigen ligase family protein [Gammaproteobacteria bacterium]
MMGAGLRYDGRPRTVPAVPPRVADDMRLPFRALMAFTFVLIIAPQTLFPVLASLRVALIAAGVAMMSYLFNRFVRHRPLVDFSREITLAACLLGWVVITLPLSYWPGGSVSYLLNIYAKTLVIFWLLTQVINTAPRLGFAAWSLSLMALPLAVSGISHFAEGKFMAESRIVGYDAPLTGNPNDLALTLNLILPLSIGLFLSRLGKPWLRGLLLVSIGLSVLGVIATYSRGGFLTLASIFVMYVSALWRRPRERHWALLALLLAFFALPFLPGDYVERLSTITNIEADASGSAQERWGVSMAALEYMLFHPAVGAGLGMDVLALNELRGPAWKEVHNVYLQYGVDLGIPGLMLFIMLLRAALRSARQAQQTARALAGDAPAGLFYLAESLRISLIAFAVAAFFHPVGYHFYFYYFAGLAVACRSIAARTAAPTQGTPAAAQPATFRRYR